MLPQQFLKAPNERYSIDMDYTGRLPIATTLVSGLWAATNRQTGQDATGTIFVSPTATIAGDRAFVELAKAGQSGEVYALTCTVITDIGNEFIDCVHMILQEC